MTATYVRGIFMDHQDVLIQLRNTVGKKEGARPQLQFPGGCVDEGETPEQALIREVKEELGVTLQPHHLEKYREFVCPDTKANVIFFKIRPEAYGLWVNFQCQEPEKFDVVTMLPLEELEEYALQMNARLYVTYLWTADALLAA